MGPAAPFDRAARLAMIGGMPALRGQSFDKVSDAFPG
jgi:hypothetical protein